VCSDRKKNFLGKLVVARFVCCGGVKELIALVFYFLQELDFFFNFFSS